MFTGQIYYHTDQRVAVLDMARELGATANATKVWRAVHEPQQLFGLRGGVFIRIKGHPRDLPPGMLETIQMQGLVLVNVDDSFAREMYAREHPKCRI